MSHVLNAAPVAIVVLCSIYIYSPRYKSISCVSVCIPDFPRSLKLLFDEISLHQIKIKAILSTHKCGSSVQDQFVCPLPSSIPQGDIYPKELDIYDDSYLNIFKYDEGDTCVTDDRGDDMAIAADIHTPTGTQRLKKNIRLQLHGIGRI